MPTISTRSASSLLACLVLVGGASACMPLVPVRLDPPVYVREKLAVRVEHVGPSGDVELKGLTTQSRLAVGLRIRNPSAEAVTVDLRNARLRLEEPTGELRHLGRPLGTGLGRPTRVSSAGDWIAPVRLGPGEALSVWVEFGGFEEDSRPEHLRIVVELPQPDAPPLRIVLAAPETGRPRWKAPARGRAAGRIPFYVSSGGPWFVAVGLPNVLFFSDDVFGFSFDFAFGPALLWSAGDFDVALEGNVHLAWDPVDLYTWRFSTLGLFVGLDALDPLGNDLDSRVHPGISAGARWIFKRSYRPPLGGPFPLLRDPTTVLDNGLSAGYVHWRTDDGWSPGFVFMLDGAL